MDEKLITERLALFKSKNKPDSLSYLVNYSREIIDLHFSGYTLKTIHKYLSENGVGCTYGTFTKWMKTNIDLSQYQNSIPELVAPKQNENSDSDSESTNKASSDSHQPLEISDKKTALPSKPPEREQNENLVIKNEVGLDTKQEIARKVAASRLKMEAQFGKSPEELVRDAQKFKTPTIK